MMNLWRDQALRRHTFLIDPNGMVRKVWNDVDVKKHSDEVLAALEQFEEERIVREKPAPLQCSFCRTGTWWGRTIERITRSASVSDFALARASRLK